MDAAPVQLRVQFERGEREEDLRGIGFGEDMADTPRADGALVPYVVAHWNQQRASFISYGHRNNVKGKKPIHSLEKHRKGKGKSQACFKRNDTLGRYIWNSCPR